VGVNSSQQWPHEFGGVVAGCCSRIVKGVAVGSRGRPLFEVFVDILLLSNLVVYAVEATQCRTFHDKGKTCTLDVVELVFFNIVFLVELVVKLLAFGIRNYRDSLTNRVDFLATVSSTILVVVYWTKLTNYDNSSILEVGVALRLTRCFRFLAYAPTFDLMSNVITKIGSNVKGLAGFMVTLFLIWATLGQQLLGQDDSLFPYFIVVL
jgi:hypothetical protein